MKDLNSHQNSIERKIDSIIFDYSKIYDLYKGEENYLRNLIRDAFKDEASQKSQSGNHNVVSKSRGQDEEVSKTSENLKLEHLGESNGEGSERVSVKVVSLPDWTSKDQEATPSHVEDLQANITPGNIPPAQIKEDLDYIEESLRFEDGSRSEVPPEFYRLKENIQKALASQKQKFLEEVNNFVKEYREKNPNPIPHTYDEGRRDGILLFQKRLKSLVSGSSHQQEASAFPSRAGSEGER